MSATSPLQKLNDMLKCNPSKKHKKKKKVQERQVEINRKYLKRTNYIGKKYIEQVMNEYGSSDDNANERKYLRKYLYDGGNTNEIGENYDNIMKKRKNDIEFTHLPNVEIDQMLCKVKGENLYEGTAGILNKVIIETISKTGECVYVENSTFEAYVKTKEELDKLNYVKDYTDKNNGYDMYIQNNLYNNFLYEKHHSLINLDHNRYNINSIFSNYKNVVNEKRESDISCPAYWDNVKGVKRNDSQPVCVTENKQVKNSSSSYTSSFVRRNINAKTNHENQDGTTTHINNSTNNETMREGYLFESETYDNENAKLTENSFRCNITDLKNGTYLVTYSLRKSGFYYLSIFNKKKKVGNSPYLIYIKPNVAYAPNCVVYKQINNKMVIPKTKNRKSKNDLKINHFYNDSLQAHSFSLVDSDFLNLEEGTDMLEGTSCSSSECSLSDEETQFPPSEENALHVLKYDSDDGWNEEEQHKKFNNFFIQSYDAYKNKIIEGKDPFEVHALGKIKIVKINNMNNGTYEVIYTYASGSRENNDDAWQVPYRQVNVTLNGVHVNGSPFRIILKNDKQMVYLSRIKNLLPIDEEVNPFDPVHNLHSIMNSYKYIKENYLDDKKKRYFMCLSPYYENTELNNILRKVDPYMVSLMSIPVKQQLFNYIRYMNTDGNIVKLKKVLFKELLVTLGKMINSANIYYDDLTQDKLSLMNERKIQNCSIREADLMYESLKEKNIHTLPFDFSIKDMKLYEQKLLNKKKELLEKQNKLIEKYNTIKSKEKKFSQERENITNLLTDKYELHQAIYEHSKKALIHTNSNLKKITITNIKRNCSTEKGVFKGKSNPYILPRD
ncbi:hypothetical protein, conserved [Plasmodium gonderi]|uniref:Uncharacterized protein n=1 Tax=Plasmodium gonderi TaxID=77519 RepID=A0A1Y1JM24_PLAGO|nr:hypothetical protein, conserved [Plasmodium gonderi]GAW81882.1 hypothetical protein, conserved [Plasmodium gonderi]